MAATASESYVFQPKEPSRHRGARARPGIAFFAGDVLVLAVRNFQCDRIKVDDAAGSPKERLGAAGIEVLEARIIHLAYAPEIAVSNLMVVLTGDRGTTPVINAGSLYA